jgi:hypothetical protein
MEQKQFGKPLQIFNEEVVESTSTGKHARVVFAS